MANGSNGAPNGIGRLLSSLGTANIVTLVTVLGAVVAVYTDIRTNQAVEADKIAQMWRTVEQIQVTQSSLSGELRAQLSQLSKDIAYLQGQLRQAEERKK